MKARDGKEKFPWLFSAKNIDGDGKKWRTGIEMATRYYKESTAKPCTESPSTKRSKKGRDLLDGERNKAESLLETSTGPIHRKRKK